MYTHPASKTTCQGARKRRILVPCNHVVGMPIVLVPCNHVVGIPIVLVPCNHIVGIPIVLVPCTMGIPTI